MGKQQICIKENEFWLRAALAFWARTFVIAWSIKATMSFVLIIFTLVQKTTSLGC